MIRPAAELCEVGLRSELRPLLLDGDWYLVGSRSTGDAAALSDRDSILITDAVDAETASIRALPSPVDVRLRQGSVLRSQVAAECATATTTASNIDIVGASAGHNVRRDARPTDRSVMTSWLANA